MRYDLTSTYSEILNSQTKPVAWESLCPGFTKLAGTAKEELEQWGAPGEPFRLCKPFMIRGPEGCRRGDALATPSQRSNFILMLLGMCVQKLHRMEASREERTVTANICRSFLRAPVLAQAAENSLMSGSLFKDSEGDSIIMMMIILVRQ